MMGRGAEGGGGGGVGIGVGSSIAHTLSRAAAVNSSSNRMSTTCRGMDLYSQAVKALAVKSPFGGDEAGSVGGAGSGFSGPLVKLPSSADPKRKNRARKTQAVSKKRNFGDIDDGNPRMFWAQMEDYFREVSAEDVRLLFPRTEFGVIDSTYAQDPCFSVRPLGRRYLDVWAEEDNKYKADVVTDGNTQQSAIRGIKRKGATGSPVSKRRKLGAAIINSSLDGMTTLISPPDPDEEDLCHVCNGGDSDGWNQIIFCDSCNVAVHQDCYGVHNVPEGQWLCSWCSHNQNSDSEPTQYKCVLCTSKGGALKPVAGGEPDSTSSKKMRFAHLFCSQWVPETYIQDTVAMEPIRNVEGVREERWRLLCVICKERHGACIQCSHGLCPTPFHPLCARDAKLWMEVSSRDDTDDVDLSAFCFKHTALRLGKASLDASEAKDGAADGAAGSPLENEAKVDEGTEQGSSPQASQSPNNGKSPVKHSEQECSVAGKRTELSDLNQGQLIAYLKEAIQHLGISMETVASEAGIPQASLLLWLEGNLHEDESKINASICSWLCTYSSLLKCSVSASEGERPLVELKKNGYSDRNSLTVKEKGSIRNEADCSESKSSIGELARVKTNCQVEDDLTSFSFEADRQNISDNVDCTQMDDKTNITVMQNESRVFGNSETCNISREVNDKAAPTKSSSSCLEAGSPREIDETPGDAEVELDKQPYVIPGVLRRLRASEPLSALEQDDLECTNASLKGTIDDQWEQLRQAKHLGILEWFPQDELEGEIFVLQNQLIDCAQSNRRASERLISKILSQLSLERQAARKQLQDLSVVSQFLADAKEAKKQGRREKRDKEAQAAVAAAAAAAAASPRTGYVKRDVGSQEDSYYPSQEVATGNSHTPYVRPYRPPVPKPPRLNAPSTFRTAQPAVCRSNALQLQEDHPPCDVCSSSESIRSNRIIQCGRCNVAVHQDCYGVIRLPAGVWYCQPCTEFQQQQQYQAVKLDDDTDRLAPGVQCALCPNVCGAFKKSSDGRWVHVFCALWVPETTFGREQTAPIGGLEAVPIERFNLICSICQRQQGACVKCNFGQCYGAFHPICARDSGLYMSVRYINGRTHYRAYCDRHSPQQRAKSADYLAQMEMKQYGSPDEISALRQIRVEFERVRLICERICKRERIKRELTHCIKDLYITQLNVMALTGGPFDNHQRAFDGNGSLYSETLLDVPWTAESKLTSTPGGECFWPIGRGVNVKELTWCKRGESPAPDSRIAVAKDHQKKLKKYSRHSEPLGREKIMTPSEASMHNKLLPKGYAYVPVDMLEKGGTPALKQYQQEQAAQAQAPQHQQQQQQSQQSSQPQQQQQQQQQQQENQQQQQVQEQQPVHSQ